MNALEVFLEKTWDGLLSREKEKIQQTFLSLDAQNQHVVLEHLKKMASEPGWHAEQVKSANVALEAISDLQGK
jgi:hypothetical protein